MNYFEIITCISVCLNTILLGLLIRMFFIHQTTTEELINRQNELLTEIRENTLLMKEESEY